MIGTLFNEEDKHENNEIPKPLGPHSRQHCNVCAVAGPSPQIDLHPALQPTSHE